MTKPVAYLVNGVAFNDIDRAKFYSDVLKYHKKIDIESLVPIPLYTVEQLHPRVKMTQAEFDDFNSLNEQFTIKGVLSYVWEHKDTKIGKLFVCRELELAQLWSDFDRDHPEETIEIIPDVKWFVISKEPIRNGKYSAIETLDIDGVYGLYERYDYDKISSNAYQFDTQEEAEKWTNPLTEAVQLPVECE